MIEKIGFILFFVSFLQACSLSVPFRVYRDDVWGISTFTVLNFGLPSYS